VLVTRKTAPPAKTASAARGIFRAVLGVSAGDEGPSVPIIVEPLTQPTEVPATPAPKEPVREPEKLPA
jgi:hypothetical protein